MLKDGKSVRCGRIDNLNVQPQQTAKVKLNLGETDTEAEWLLNISYKLKNNEDLLPAGYTVAKEQLTLNPYKAPSMQLGNCELSNTETVAPEVQDNDRHYLIIGNDAFRIEFSRSNGYLTKYQIKGLDMIKEGAILKPNFWRAPTDNDFGAHIHRKYVARKNPEIRLKSLKQRTENKQVIVETAYEDAGSVCETQSDIRHQ